MKTRTYYLPLAITIISLTISGCAFYYKINRHFSQGEQVYIQRRDDCGRPDKFGEVTEQPNSKDSSGRIIYRVRDRDGWVMPYSEKFLDSLNNWF